MNRSVKIYEQVENIFSAAVPGKENLCQWGIRNCKFYALVARIFDRILLKFTHQGENHEINVYYLALYSKLMKNINKRHKQCLF